MRLEATILFVLLWRLTSGIGHLRLGANGTDELLSRQRRYIVFPKGASLQLLIEVLVHVPTQLQVFIGPTMQVAWPLPSEVEVTNPPDRIFRFRSRETPWWRRKKILQDVTSTIDLFGMTVGLAWQLPDDPQIYSESKKKHKIYKRNALKKVEGFMRPAGADGKQCVLRALCESGQRTPAKKEFLREILHKIFSYDEENEDLEDTHEDKLYRRAHKSKNLNCEALYPGCPFSVFAFLR